MRFNSLILVIPTLSLGACGAEPALVRDGPGVTAAPFKTVRLGQSPGRQVVFSRDGALLAAANAAGDLTVRRTSDWRIVRRLTHSGGATALAFSKESRRLISAGYNGRIHVWNLESGAGTSMAASKGPVWTVDVSADGRRLAAAGEDAMVRLWALDRLQAPPRLLRGHQRNVWEVRFSAAGALASGSFDHSARIWPGGGQPARVLAGHSQAVVGLDFSPDGGTLATGGDDSTIRFWQVSDGSLRRTIAAGNHVYKVEFSPDGKWLASGGRARSALGTFWYDLTGWGAAATPVQIWRAADGALVASLPHPADIASIAYSPDGGLLATTDEQGDLRLWRLAPGRTD